ncbi:MAG: MATE family efflux transporter [Spirochaetota bacterium]
MSHPKTQHKPETSSLTSGSVPQLLRRIAIPAAVGTIFNTFYNLVDTFWAGQYSTESLAALSLNFPVYQIALSVGIGFTTGLGALISNNLGAKNEAEAQIILFRGISFALLLHVILAGILFAGLEPLFALFEAEADVMPRALGYGRVIVGGSVFITTTMTLNAALTARGNTRTYRNILIAGFFLNLALDPLLMFGVSVGSVVLIPALAETGIALATIVIQLLSTLIIIRKEYKDHLFAGIRWQDLLPDLPRYREIAGQVFPAMSNFLIMATGTLVITFFISRYGTAVVAAYGSAVRIEQIALVPTTGLATALAALVGQNNGAGRIDRVYESFKTALRYGLFIMLCLLTPVLVFGKSILELFTTNSNVVSIGYQYLLIQGITFYSYIILFLSNSVLQGLKRPMMVMWMGFYRQLAAPAVVFSLLSFALDMEEKGVWWGLVIVNWTAALITLMWAKKKLTEKTPIGG